MMIILIISDLGRLTDDDYTKYIRSRSVNRWYDDILCILDLGRLTDDDYTNYIRSRSVNRWWLYYLYQI